ncbi:MAG: hypothetical protein ACLPVJ_19310 [Syntrophobacteraceae bacterium]
MESTESPKELLKNKVVALVMEYVRGEGGMTIRDLKDLFGGGSPIDNSVASALEKIPICFAAPPQ